jgi:hypothetical protein
MAGMLMQSSEPMSPLLSFFFRRIFPWPFILGGAFALFYGIRGVIRGKASFSWPTIRGVIQESSIEHKVSFDSHGGGAGTYHAKLRYAFVLEGVTHSGSRVAYGDFGSSDPSHAQNIVNRYPVGKEVTVHYMPGDPDESVLEPGTNFGTWIVPLIGFAFATAGILTFVFLPRMMAKAA